MKNKSVGIVADWLVTFAGAEKVIKEFIDIYPDSSLYSVVDFLSDNSRTQFNGKVASTSFIQSLPGSKKHYQKYLPLMPIAIEQIDVSQHDLIISSSHAVSKGIITGPDQLHISYVHSPIRYAWDLQHQYLKEAGLQRGLKGMLSKYILHKMRIWDYRTANSVDHFVANSQFIARRIKKFYGRDADVIYPPVNVDKFTLFEKKDDFYLTASRMVPYKKMDLIVDAFSKMKNKKLVVIGDGPEMEKIKSKASSNIEILGYQEDDVMIDYMQRAKAFVFASLEDFGISPLEAQACGTPVIAFGKGGALETVRPSGVSRPTGVFFAEQNVQSLIDAIDAFELTIDNYSPESCRDNALQFSDQRFRDEFRKYTENKWEQFCDSKKIKYSE
ncbi:glycosyltransferase family 4 protein [Serratia fonticola]|uniref:glycosyltransferase family 4 protein n=1 Tax=Serratia fonticola TaxID=47917 RepID=UPI0015C690CA|nr:glycosyltransferase family 4 protein [Serratia fonticola]MBC3380905.1 glycosyltransferase family 4 protein [Serratia fonticola]NYA40104.1 glycosyltransferase family 4 protein [Serratia fonticola]